MQLSGVVLSTLGTNGQAMKPFTQDMQLGHTDTSPLAVQSKRYASEQGGIATFFKPVHDPVPLPAPSRANKKQCCPKQSSTAAAGRS